MGWRIVNDEVKLALAIIGKLAVYTLHASIRCWGFSSVLTWLRGQRAALVIGAIPADHDQLRTSSGPAPALTCKLPEALDIYQQKLTIAKHLVGLIRGLIGATFGATFISTVRRRCQIGI
jgi:hypothetical protein